MTCKIINNKRQSKIKTKVTEETKRNTIEVVEFSILVQIFNISGNKIQKDMKEQTIKLLKNNGYKFQCIVSNFQEILIYF